MYQKRQAKVPNEPFTAALYVCPLQCIRVAMHGVLLLSRKCAIPIFDNDLVRTKQLGIEPMRKYRLVRIENCKKKNYYSQSRTGRNKRDRGAGKKVAFLRDTFV